MAKATDCKSVFYEFDSHPCLFYSIVAQWLECSVVSRDVASSNLVGTANLGR